SSTNNTRIERLWVEVGTHFARSWRAFFIRLERLHGFDRDNPHHLWLLHYLFLSQINNDCKTFQEHWNHHPISGKGKNQTPLDMRLIGELKYGRYTDNLDNIHPEVVARYNDDVIQSNKWIQDDMDAAIAEDQGRHIRHEPIDVPKHSSPFSTVEAEELFSQALSTVQAEGIVPVGLGVAEAEWEGGIYSEVEVIKVGRKDSEVDIPFSVWWPRAVAWVQGLELMVRVQAAENGDIML
ncbi:hypothetical protein C8R44DRAFT_644623, partial [Mycena epipterygia]